MADKLIVSDDGDGSVRLVWWLDDGNDIGAAVGDGYVPGAPSPNRETNEESWQLWAADRAALPFIDPNARHTDGFEFETKAKARAALAAIKMAWSATRPLFDWENKALAAGWKPPKGWTGNTEEGKQSEIHVRG